MRLRHLPFAIANTDTMDVVHPRSGIGFGLKNLPSATQEVHIVDVGTTERSLQCLEMVARRHTEHLNLVAIDVEVDRGVRGREPREHLGMASLGTADFRLAYCSSMAGSEWPTSPSVLLMRRTAETGDVHPEGAIAH